MARTRRAVRTLDTLVARAGLIFVGAVGAPVRVPGVSASDRTVLVDVENVLQAPIVLGDLTGKTITVLLSTAIRHPREGARYTFFATSWRYGETVAVAEVARMKPDEELRLQIPESNARLAELALTTRVEKASLIVSGRVSAVSTPKKASRFLSEHDPQWLEAIIEVGSIEKGRIKGKTVLILFPSSTDDAWLDSPKCRPGQTGTWILQRNQQERGAPAFRWSGLTALDPLDYQPPDRRDALVMLIRRSVGTGR